MIPELVNSAGFFYGSNPSYALIDTLSQRVYLVEVDLGPLLLIKKVFSSKRNLAAIELPAAYKGTNQIDNSVSINWQVKVVPGIDLFPGKGFFHPEDTDLLTKYRGLLPKGSFSTQINQNIEHLFCLEQTEYLADDIDIVKQMFMLHFINRYAFKGNGIDVECEDLNNIRKAFEISLTSADLIQNLAYLAERMYNQNNMVVGCVLYNVLPRELRFL